MFKMTMTIPKIQNVAENEKRNEREIQNVTNKKIRDRQIIIAKTDNTKSVEQRNLSTHNPHFGQNTPSRKKFNSRSRNNFRLLCDLSLKTMHYSLIDW